MTSIFIVLRELVPVYRQGIALGVVNLLGWIGMGLGDYQAGFLFDPSGGYAWPFKAAIASGLVNMVLVAGLVVFVSRSRAPAAQFGAA